LRLVTLAVALRPGAAVEADPRVRAAPMLRIELPPMAASATAIRARVARAESIAGLVSDAVAGYIDQHHLYRSAAGH
ncbi:MAG TPA: nicotinate-nicotinamide nucleotide adenylyltransferase, partial [Burkholderiaceae bacterium]|nr:nicotinate-nicotinamide nucleotide adenylyltransferase [Burkholderiaceae bacterium]